MSTLLVNQINPVSGNTLTLSGSNIIIPGNLTITGNLSGSLTGSVESSSYALTSSYALDSTNAVNATSSSYALTASYVLGGGSTTNTSSLLTTASISGQTLTFTKGDASTFDVTIPSGGSIDTGSFATTGSNQFSGSQGITGSVTIADSDLSLAMNQNFIVFENLNSPNDVGTITRVGSTYSEGGNTQAFLFPSSPTGGYKTITLPNDTGTVALTHNTATTGSNTFRGNQIVNANLTLTSSATMSILTTGGSFPGMQITRDQVSINPNLNSDRALLYGGSLQLSSVNGYSGLYLTNRNGSSDTSSIEIHRMQFYGKDTDTYNGLKAGLRVYQVVGTGSLGSFNFYTSASAGFGFTSGDIDMRISSGSKIELFRNTTITGSVSITSVLTLAPNDPLPSGQPTGSIAVSGSGVDCKPYFWNGATWTSMI